VPRSMLDAITENIGGDEGLNILDYDPTKPLGIM
jgi:hypothetical protein